MTSEIRGTFVYLPSQNSISGTCPTSQQDVGQTSLRDVDGRTFRELLVRLRITMVAAYDKLCGLDQNLKRDRPDYYVQIQTGEMCSQLPCLGSTFSFESNVLLHFANTAVQIAWEARELAHLIRWVRRVPEPVGFAPLTGDVASCSTTKQGWLVLGTW